MVYDELTAEENLLLFARLQGIARPKERVAALLEEVSLTERRESLVRTFSRGMRQRVAIARALLTEPSVLLLDEPATGLDSHGIAWLAQTLRGMRDAGCTLLMSLHGESEISALATRGIRLDAGAVVGDTNAGADDEFECLARSGRMSLLANTGVLLGKELKTEFRSRELLTTTIIFVIIVLVLFSFTFDPLSDEARRFGSGLLWLAFLFAASLMLQPCFLREQTNDTLSALRLSVSDPFAIFLAKLAANTLFLMVTELLLLPVFAVMYSVTVSSVLPWLVLVFFLGSLGVSIAGTALSSISAQARMRELLLPLLLLPMLTPILIASTEVTAALLDRSPYVLWKGIGFLVAFDIVFLTALWLFGEYLLEE